MQSLNPNEPAAFPAALAYDNRAPTYAAELERRVIPPSGGGGGQYAPGQTIEFEIPTTRGTYLDTGSSYIKFRFNNRSVNAATPPANIPVRLSHGPSSLISELTVRHNTETIEYIQQYNHLVAFLTRLQCGDDNVSSVRSALEGISFRRKNLAKAAAGGVGAHNYSSNDDIRVENEEIGNVSSRVFVTQLLSGVVGPQLDNYFPLGYIENGGPLRIELKLEDAANALITEAANVAPNYFISDIELVLAIIVLNPAADAILYQSVMNMTAAQAVDQGQLFIPTESWKGVRNNIPAGALVSSLILPFRYQSMKSIIGLLQPSEYTNAPNQMAVGSYPRNNLRQYQWTYGGKTFPSRAIQCGGSGAFTEAYAELLNCMFGLSAPNSTLGITRRNYDMDGHVADYGADAAVYGQPFFAIGQQMETYSVRSPGLQSGMNTMTQTLMWDGTFTTVTPAALNAFFFGHFDMSLVIDMANGTLKHRA